MDSFIERHMDQIEAVVSRFDWIVITGTLPDICRASAMTAFLNSRRIRIFDYPFKGDGRERLALLWLVNKKQTFCLF